MGGVASPAFLWSGGVYRMAAPESRGTSAELPLAGVAGRADIGLPVVDVRAFLGIRGMRA